MGSLTCALSVVGFIWSRCVNGSFRFVGFTRVRPAGHRAYLGSLGSRGFALGVVELDKRRCALGVVGFIQGRWVYSGAPWGSSGSFGVVGFAWVHPGGRQVHSGSLC